MGGAYGHAGVGTPELRDGLLRLFKLLRLLRLEPGTPVTADGTMLDVMEEMELGGENMVWEESGLTFMELKKGKLLVDKEADVRPLAAQLLYV